MAKPKGTTSEQLPLVVGRGGSGLASTIWRYIRKHGAAPGQYRVLCHNCNQGRYFNGGTCPHEDERRALAEAR